MEEDEKKVENFTPEVEEDEINTEEEKREETEIREEDPGESDPEPEIAEVEGSSLIASVIENRLTNLETEVENLKTSLIQMTHQYDKLSVDTVIATDRLGYIEKDEPETFSELLKRI